MKHAWGLFGEAGVYVVHSFSNDGLVKIGFSNDFYRRLGQIAPDVELCHSIYCLNREMAIIVEAALHTLFADRRVRGEWFNLVEEYAEDGTPELDSKIYELDTADYVLQEYWSHVFNTAALWEDSEETMA